MAKPRKLKQEAAAAVPQNQEEANRAIARIGICQRERERIAAAMNDALAAVKADYEAKAAFFKDEIENHSKGLQTWCEAHRAELTLGGKRKFYRFGAGEIQWRMRPPKVAVRGVAAVIAALKAKKLAHVFLRVKEEIDKEAMLKSPVLAQTVKGVSIEQGEDFVIKPFETELEEVRP